MAPILAEALITPRRSGFTIGRLRRRLPTEISRPATSLWFPSQGSITIAVVARRIAEGGSPEVFHVRMVPRWPVRRAVRFATTPFPRHPLKRHFKTMLSTTRRSTLRRSSRRTPAPSISRVTTLKQEADALLKRQTSTGAAKIYVQIVTIAPTTPRLGGGSPISGCSFRQQPKTTVRHGSRKRARPLTSPTSGLRRPRRSRTRSSRSPLPSPSAKSGGRR